MLKKRFVTLLFVVLVTLAGCAKQPGATRYKGKLKKGKPIPCPVKDC